ncbi:MAG TPA: hypothetical protein VGC74_01005 [Stenotrophomonas sp.]
MSEAASLRDRPSSTNAKASMRRTCAPSVHLPASTRNSALVWSAQVTFNVAPIDPPEANRLLRTSNQISPPWGIRPESQGPCGLVLEIWAAGYLSGAAMGTRKDFLAGFDIGAVFAWLDNSCRANPLQPFTASLNALIRERVGTASQ